MKKKFIIKWTDLRKAFVRENIFGKEVYKRCSHRENDINSAWSYGKKLADSELNSNIVTYTVFYFKLFWIEIPYFFVKETFVYGGKNQ